MSVASLPRFQLLLFFLASIGIFPIVVARPIQSEEVVLAIDCGSTQPYKSSDGIIYQPDNLFTTNSKIADYTFNPSISKKKLKFTDDQQLYKTERHADDSFAYSLPINSPGTYTLILKFCEMYFTEVNKRVFEIRFGNSFVASIDIVKEVGPLAAYDLYIEFEKRSSNEYVFKGTVCSGAVDSTRNNGLIVQFRSTGKDLPKVDAMLVLRGSIADSNQHEYKELVKKWDDHVNANYANEESAQQSSQRFENLRQILKDEYDTSLDLQTYNSSKFEGVIDILLSWKGLLILMTLVIFQLCLFCSEDPQDDSVIERKQKQFGSGGSAAHTHAHSNSSGATSATNSTSAASADLNVPTAQVAEKNSKKKK